MADYNKEFKRVIQNEGGYVNDPDDAGGETLFGISRKYHPNARFWKNIDQLKKFHNTSSIKKMMKHLSDTDNVLIEVKSIYKNNYWDIFDLDKVNNQEVAHQIFDTAVNMGVKVATSIAQQVIGMTITGKISDELLYNLKKY